VAVERYFHPNINYLGTGSTLTWQPAGTHGREEVGADDSNVNMRAFGIQLVGLSRNVFANQAGAGRIDTPTFLASAKSQCGATSVGSLAASPGNNYGGVLEQNGGTVPPIAPGATVTFQVAYRIY
jgi:hypothetical protein